MEIKEINGMFRIWISYVNRFMHDNGEILQFSSREKAEDELQRHIEEEY